MKTYLLNNVDLYVIEPEFSYMLPDGCIEITDDEAEAIRISRIPPEPEPTYSCSPWQIRKALNALGARQFVEDYITSAGATQDEKDGWQYATSFSSDDPLVLNTGALLNMDAEVVRSFISGASLL